MGKPNLEMRKIPSLNFLYEVNENGTIFRNVKSKKQYRIRLDMHHSDSGYYVTFCRFKGKPTRVMIHRVVAECWLGKCPDNMEVDHIDRNTKNNDFRNLRYVSKSKQMKNRDHSRISLRGKENLSNYRKTIMKKVYLTYIPDSSIFEFESYSSASRFLSNFYYCNEFNFEKFRYRLKRKSKKIQDFSVKYFSDCRDYTC